MIWAKRQLPKKRVHVESAEIDTEVFHMSDDNSEDKVPWFVRLHVAERDFEIGDPLAVDAGVLACFEGGIPIPDWAMPELATRAEIALGVKKAPPKRGGPQSNPTNLSRDRHKRFAAICMVMAAEDERLKGDRKFEIAKKALDSIGVFYEAHTLKRYWKENRKRSGASSQIHLDKAELQHSWSMERFKAAITNTLLEIE
jgi:hypothetical protein